MARVRKVLIYLGGAVLVLCLLVVGAWVYVTSNVPEPEFRVLASDGPIEHRAYDAMVVAEVTRSGSRYDAVRAGFGPLARYIFARERDGEKIAMTAPVTQRAAGDRDWVVQFIMPADYALGDLPTPTQGDVRLSPVTAAERAAIRFSGVATDELIADQEAKLRAWIDAQGLTANGAPVYAYYNDPITPGFLRRNEVIIDLASP
ncbi:MAG: heme-binding protein [Pseudomonadota bacterium]